VGAAEALGGACEDRFARTARVLASVFNPLWALRRTPFLRRMAGGAEDQSVYRTPSTAEGFLILSLCAPFYLFFAYFDQPFRGFVAGLSAGVVMSLVSLLWRLVRRASFSTCLGITAVAHAALVYWLPYTGEFRFGFALLPLVVADIYLCARAIVFLNGGSAGDRV
jgi:hypothetical protein